jgi:hypothetical protein
LAELTSTFFRALRRYNKADEVGQRSLGLKNAEDSVTLGPKQG